MALIHSNLKGEEKVPLVPSDDSVLHPGLPAFLAHPLWWKICQCWPERRQPWTGCWPWTNRHRKCVKPRIISELLVQLGALCALPLCGITVVLFLLWGERNLPCLWISSKLSSFSNCSLCSDELKYTYLLAAVESFTFFPSKEAKCCSRASSRLLGA